MSEYSIIAENISKKYVIGSKSHGSLRESIASWFDKKKSTETFWALDDLNFKINAGEAIGIIGRNGAGKSTLLKILSRITTPTKGRIEMYGRVASLLEVGTGFHPELTGRENIFLNGSLLGMSNSEIRSQLDEIIDFSGVEKFINTPVKRFSSGMYVRLAFAVAAHLNTEILLVDEVLAVGDLEFRNKCIGKMNSIKDSGKTVLLVSHNLSSINELCANTMILDEGKITFFGKTPTAIDKYSQRELKYTESKAKILSLTDYGNDENFEYFTLNFMNGDIPNLLSLSVSNEFNQKVFFSEYSRTKDKVEVRIPKTNLASGEYIVSLNIKDEDSREIKHRFEFLTKFNIGNFESKYSMYKKENLGILKDSINWK